MTIRALTRHFMIRLFKWLSIAIVFSIVSTCAIIFFAPVPPLLAGIPFSRAIYSEKQQLLRLTLSTDAKYRLYSALDDIAPSMLNATLLQEDQYFQSHVGINPFALIKAAWHTYLTQSRRMGGSTITMQVARMRYGIHSKTVFGKMWQSVRALQLEMHYSKNQILEAYLNLAPYGNNVEGIAAASLIYFGKNASDLTLPEVLTLAVIPQNPNKRALTPTLLQSSRQKLFTRWLSGHPEDKNKKALLALPIQMRSVHQVPFLAPHFVNQVLSTTSASHVVTTLNLDLQKMLERITRNYILRKKIVGIKNAAVLLLDYRNMEVKALLGSVDFFNQDISGQVNGTTIKRSPGSTLKPFIYALAIDQGLIHPTTVLKDVPHSIGSYNPENFDYDFMGPIKAKDALVLSRNIPAITLAEQLQHPSLYEFLRTTNISDLKSENYYGMSLVLGGAELSMQELVSLYAMLGNEGRWQTLCFTKNCTPEMTKPLFSREASFLVVDMLKETGNKTSASYKTGTSSGFRDAWTLGIIGPYVLAVWVGNFNNQSNPALLGKEMAAPLFLEINHALQSQFSPLPPVAINPLPLNLKKVAVCKISGMLPTRNCHDTEYTWFIPGKSPIKTDTIHREIAIDSKTGLRACHFDKNTRFEVFEFWSSDLLKIFKLAGIERRTPPAFTPDCTMKNIKEEFAPQIISPQTQVHYIARINQGKETLLPLAAVTDADIKNLYWFANETFLGQSAHDKTFFWSAKPGRYVIRAVDDYGRADARVVSVQAEH